MEWIVLGRGEMRIRVAGLLCGGIWRSESGSALVQRSGDPGAVVDADGVGRVGFIFTTGLEERRMSRTMSR